MRRYIILSLIISSVLLLSCTKDEYEDITTSFQGIVLNADTNEPVTNGQIEIIGSDAGSGPYDAYRKMFQIESDGTFNIRITTSSISLFQIDFEGFSQYCSGPTISQYCTLMSAGQSHTDIRVLVGGIRP